MEREDDGPSHGYGVASHSRTRTHIDPRRADAEEDVQTFVADGPDPTQHHGLGAARDQARVGVAESGLGGIPLIVGGCPDVEQQASRVMDHHTHWVTATTDNGDGELLWAGWRWRTGP